MPSAIRSIVSRYWPSAFCIIGFTLTFIAYYPGFLSPDSLDQYQQALTGRYEDWHPPIMAGFWRLLNYIHKGPQLLLVYQLGCLWLSIYLLLTAMPGWRWQLAIALLAWAPFVQNFAGYIVKDSGMALSWLLAFAMLLRYSLSGKLVPVYTAFFIALLLLYGCWVRTNAFPAAIPLAIWFITIVFKHKRRLIKYAAAILFLTCMLSGKMAQQQLFHAEKTHPEYKVYMQDLTGIYAKTGKGYYPPILYNYEHFDTSYLRKHYSPATFDHIWAVDSLSFIPETDDKTAAALHKAWLRALRSQPVAYVKNRMQAHLYYLRLIDRTEAPCNVSFAHITNNDFGFTWHPNTLSSIIFTAINWQAPMPYMRPWFWFAFTFLLLFLSSRIKTKALRQAAYTLIISGILYQALMFFVFPIDTDFRYFYWNCISASLAFCLWVADRSASR